jgi:hypothetical protein
LPNPPWAEATGLKNNAPSGLESLNQRGWGFFDRLRSSFIHFYNGRFPSSWDFFDRLRSSFIHFYNGRFPSNCPG